jgi:DNA-binding IclR family transcriptional regulator
MSQGYKSTSTAVERTLAIVEAIRQHGSMTVGGLARCLRIPKTSAWYIVHTLQMQGYLVLDPERRAYRLSCKFVNLSEDASLEARLKRLVTPYLIFLREKTHLTAASAAMDMIICHMDVPSVKLRELAGPRLEPHASAGGKLYVAFMPDALALLNRCGMARWTPNTITQRVRLLTELEQIRRQGYSLDNEEFIRGIRSVAVPLFGRGEALKGSVGLVGTASEMPDSRLPALITIAKQSARVISEHLQGAAQPGPD